MNHKPLHWIGIFLLSFALATLTVSAIGISPGRTMVTFTPALEQTIAFKVVNTEQKAMDVILYAEGELASYITLSEEQLHFAEGEVEKQLTYTFSLPNSLGEPGLHRAQIIAREFTPPTEKGEIVVKALLAVASALDVRVPYPGKYIKAHFYIAATEEHEPVPFLLQAQNLGTEDIKNAKATIDIIDQTSTVVATVQTESVEILAGGKADMFAYWDAAISFGQYLAEATITYDGQVITEKQPFQLGSFGLEPLDIAVNDFTLGEVAKFNILVKNKGEQDAQEAIARITLHNAEAAPLADFASVSTLIPATTVKALLAYWDTEEIVQGTYEGSLTLTADRASSEYRLRTTVTEDAIRTEFLGITGRAITPTLASPEALNKQAAIALLTLLVVLINTVGWYIYFKRKGNDRKGELMDNF